MGGRIIDDNVIATYSGMVAQVASEYHRKYPMVERDDIKQELWLWFLEHPKKFAAWTTEDDEGSSDKLIARSLRNAAYDFCFKEKARVEGYDPSDVFFYKEEFIKTLLPAVLSDDWKRVEMSMSNSTTQKRPSESGDWMAYAADIRRAYNSLEVDYRKLVFLYYAQDIPERELYELVKDVRPTPKAAAQAANRALKKMVKFLGGYPPHRENDIVEAPSDDSTGS